jgi:DNA-binding NtrC family response regulator
MFIPKLLFIKGVLTMSRTAESNRAVEGPADYPGFKGALNPSASDKSIDTDINEPKRILLVDDDHSIRKILCLLLTALKFEVKSFDNAYDALKHFIDEAFALVMTDIQMPGMDGWELAVNIKKRSPNTPVILITGMDKSQVEESMKKGIADSVLYKPVTLKHLEEVIYSFI